MISTQASNVHGLDPDELRVLGHRLTSMTLVLWVRCNKPVVVAAARQQTRSRTNRQSVQRRCCAPLDPLIARKGVPWYTGTKYIGIPSTCSPLARTITLARSHCVSWTPGYVSAKKCCLGLCPAGERYELVAPDYSGPPAARWYLSSASARPRRPRAHERAKRRRRRPADEAAPRILGAGRAGAPCRRRRAKHASSTPRPSTR